MQNLTPEQFKAKYGEQALSRFGEIDSARFGTTNQETSSTSKPFSNKVTDFLGLGNATKTFGNVLNQVGIGVPEGTDKQYLTKPTGSEVAGAVAQTAGIVGGIAVTGGSSLAGQVAAGAGAGYLYDVGQKLQDKEKTASEVFTPGVGTAVGAVAPAAVGGVVKGTGALVGAIKRPATKGVDAVTNAIPDSTTAQGVTQTAKEYAERVPRFVGRVNEDIKTAALKGQRIRTSSPEIAQAIKVDLPESFIQTVPNASPEAKKAFKEVLDIADAPKTTLGQKSNPAIVGGEYASKQYDVINAQRKKVGEAIGEATKKLSKTQQVDMRPAYNQLDNLLVDQGITPVYGTKGVELDFSKSNLAPKQRQVVKDLYKLATEAGDNLSPFEIHKKDQLFSAIQREARADQVADVLIDLPDGTKTDLFRAFRDVYSNELDTLGPEIKNLNSQYRNIVTLQDDIENSIFKTPNFNITKSTDQAEFAKVNLRRIFGEAQSSPVYEAIADEMDAISRQLGYNGASPKEVAAFAQEIRALYPETVPSGGFRGGISASIKDVAGQLLSAGKADTADQRKALRVLVEATEQASK